MPELWIYGFHILPLIRVYWVQLVKQSDCHGNKRLSQPNVSSLWSIMDYVNESKADGSSRKDQVTHYTDASKDLRMWSKREATASKLHMLDLRSNWEGWSGRFINTHRLLSTVRPISLGGENAQLISRTTRFRDWRQWWWISGSQG